MRWERWQARQMEMKIQLTPILPILKCSRLELLRTPILSATRQSQKEKKVEDMGIPKKVPFITISTKKVRAIAMKTAMNTPLRIYLTMRRQRTTLKLILFLTVVMMWQIQKMTNCKLEITPIMMKTSMYMYHLNPKSKRIFVWFRGANTISSWYWKFTLDGEYRLNSTQQFIILRSCWVCWQQPRVIFVFRGKLEVVLSPQEVLILHWTNYELLKPEEEAGVQGWGYSLAVMQKSCLDLESRVDQTGYSCVVVGVQSYMQLRVIRQLSATADEPKLNSLMGCALQPYKLHSDALWVICEKQRQSPSFQQLEKQGMQGMDSWSKPWIGVEVRSSSRSMNLWWISDWTWLAVGFIG